MSRSISLVAHAIVPLLLAIAPPLLRAEPQTLVTFCALGDTPYTPIEFISLPKQIAELPTSAEFAVHLGDIKTGVVPCVEPLYSKVAEILAVRDLPVFIIPGDNEWNDCPNPDQAWRYWSKHFLRFDERWKHDFRPTRQPDREENFAFFRKGVLFVGINLVGGKVHDKDEWRVRHQANLDWIAKSLAAKEKVSRLVILAHATPQRTHEDFFEGFVKQARDFNRPVLYLHGDGHRWIKNRPWGERNDVDILRVQVDQGLKAPPVLITVTDDPGEPFVFDRRKPAEAAGKPKEETKSPQAQTP